MDIMDWNMFAPPNHGSIPRVHLIAFLDSTPENYCESVDRIEIGECYNSNSGNTTLSSGDGSSSSIIIGDLCSKIAQRRGHPSEILYECTLYDFLEIAFAWSQSKLFDIGGKAVVKMIQGMTELPKSVMHRFIGVVLLCSFVFAFK
ncbi:unnamed protein product [Thelazia callipaeda]|uniref:Pkinase_fungal domain-containing protein n=1 Tax=Thelazia callipaeda TaxID=103827 RepID=A0A0N5CNN9_THECL|nr:unnamed protein product [Thelazia callipaeda]